MKLLTTVLIMSLTQNLSAQADTTFKYYNINWKVCARDTAVYVSKVYAEGNQFKQKDYWIKGMKPQMDASWKDAGLKRPAGTATWYNEAGTVTKSETYENDRTAATKYYYDNGKQKASILYDVAGKITSQKGWSTDGMEIPRYIYEQEARFPGGTSAWQEYLISKINYKLAANEKAPVGMYTVKVQFLVNKEGRTERVQAIDVPAQCKKCGPAAVKIITQSPKWEPAIQFGQPVIYQAIQNISWQVEEG